MRVSIVQAQREALGYDPKVEASMRQASNQKKDEIMRTQEVYLGWPRK